MACSFVSVASRLRGMEVRVVDGQRLWIRSGKATAIHIRVRR